MPGRRPLNLTPREQLAGQLRDSKIHREDFWSGGWCRFSRYEIRGGHIRPTKNANLEWYDPWEIYRISRTDAPTRPPYEDLLKLLHSLGVRDHSATNWGKEEVFQSDGSLTPAQEDKILDWCRRYGLLGILPHMAHIIELPGRVLKSRVSGRSMQRRNIRVNGKWVRQFRAFPPGEVQSEKLFFGEYSEEGDQTLPEDPDPGPLVPTDDRIYERPQVFLAYRTAPVSWMLPKYFPDFEDAGDQFDCPLPLSPDFCRIYSETEREFVHAAMLLLEAVAPVSSSYYINQNLQAFDRLLEPVGLKFSFDGRKIQEQWVCPSLLSSFGRMAFQDLSKGMRVLRCACCGAPFATSGYQGRYCSKQCGYRLRKRRARARKIEQSKQE